MQNNLSEFGKKIKTLRESKSMTQDDLARHLGLSAQAVSKWENGDGFPEVSVLPSIVALLETDYNYLMGHEPPVTHENFPPSIENLPRVHTYGRVACYSAKPVESIQGSGVTFADGSTAELAGELVVNRGAGEIRFFSVEDVHQRGHRVKPSEQMEFGGRTSFLLPVSNGMMLDLRGVDCKILKSSDESTHVVASGEISKLETFEANVDGDGNDRVLHVRAKTKSKKFFGFIGSMWDDKVRPIITVRVPFDSGVLGSIKLSGTGTSESAIPHFKRGELFIQGSGDIKMLDIDECDARISGSGDISIGKTTSCRTQIAGSGDVKVVSANDAVAKISGSGDIEFGDTVRLDAKITGSGDITATKAIELSASVTGSGDIKIDKIDGGDVSVSVGGAGTISIKEGRANMFKVSVTGAGDIRAKSVVATKADISVVAGGRCVLGHVIDTSKEQAKAGGKITINGRGPI